MFGWRSADAADRYKRLFAGASREFDQRIKAIVASHAEKGLLVSGATIRIAVRATSEVTHDAVSEALHGIETLTNHRGRERKAMLAKLAVALAAHHVAIETQAGAALTKIGLGNDVRHATPLFATERKRHTELITDFQEGWTAPASKPWSERHPILFLVVGALLTFALGWGAKSLIGDQWQSAKGTSAVAPLVAPEPEKSTKLPEKNH